MSLAYVALGANLGERLATLESAIDALSRAGEVRAVSSIYETDPVGFAEQPPYLNAVLALETPLTPEELLDVLLAIELEHGRERSFANAPRTLDLDLLIYGNERRATARLTLPHPRLHERAFVLVPLAEITPDAVVPGHGATVSELQDRIDAETGIHKVMPPPQPGT